MMKSKRNWWLRPVMLALMLSCIPRPSAGQGRVSLEPGVGMPEMINLGIRVRVADQARVGFSIGWWPAAEGGWISWGNIISITGDFYIHFAGSSELSPLRPWYGRIGINYSRDADEPYFLPVFLRIGRQLNINERNGFAIDVGAGFNMIYKSAATEALIPAIGICYFHRFSSN